MCWPADWKCTCLSGERFSFCSTKQGRFFSLRAVCGLIWRNGNEYQPERREGDWTDEKKESALTEGELICSVRCYKVFRTNEVRFMLVTGRKERLSWTKRRERVLAVDRKGIVFIVALSQAKSLFLLQLTATHSVYLSYGSRWWHNVKYLWVLWYLSLRKGHLHKFLFFLSQDQLLTSPF